MQMSRVMANEAYRSIAPLCVPTKAIAISAVVLGALTCNLPKPTELIIENPEIWWKSVYADVELEDINKSITLILESLSLN